MKSGVRQTEPDWNSVGGVRARMARCKHLKNKIRLAGNLSAFGKSRFSLNGIRTTALEINGTGHLILGGIVAEKQCSFVEARHKNDDSLYHVYLDATFEGHDEVAPKQLGPVSIDDIRITSIVTAFLRSNPPDTRGRELPPAVDGLLYLTGPIYVVGTTEMAKTEIFALLGRPLVRNDGRLTTPEPYWGEITTEAFVTMFEWTVFDVLEIESIGALKVVKFLWNEPGGENGKGSFVVLKSEDGRRYAVELFWAEEDRPKYNGGRLPERSRVAIIDDRIPDADASPEEV